MTRRVWQLDKHGRPVRLVDVETFEDAVKPPPAWLRTALVAIAIGLIAWQGGVCW